jgi:hypothetical protein
MICDRTAWGIAVAPAQEPVLFFGSTTFTLPLNFYNFVNLNFSIALVSRWTIGQFRTGQGFERLQFRLRKI